jgi:hypothetical protein
MERNFDREISDTESTIASLDQEMEATKELFIAASVDFLQNFWESRTIEFIKAEPGIAKELSRDKMSELKRAVMDLRDRTESHVRSIFSNDKIWWHEGDVRTYKPFEYMSKSEFVKEPLDILDHPLKIVAGNLIGILEDYGFLKGRRWRLYSSGKQPPIDSNTPYYSDKWFWTPDMAARAYHYESLADKQRKATHKLAELKKEKEQSEAEDIWLRA